MPESHFVPVIGSPLDRIRQLQAEREVALLTQAQAAAQPMP